MVINVGVVSVRTGLADRRRVLDVRDRMPDVGEIEAVFFTGPGIAGIAFGSGAGFLEVCFFE